MAKDLIFVSLLVCLTAQICSGLIGTVCTYKKENALANFARSCGRGGNERLCRRLFFKPKDDKDTYKDCCPGFTNKGPFGCLTKTCIVLPQDALKKAMCPLIRTFDLAAQRLFYKLTTPPEKPLAYPNETDDLFQAVPFPLLDQESLKVVLRSVTHLELHETDWVIRYIAMAQRNSKITEKSLEPGNLQPFTKYSDYAALLKAYRDEQPKDLIPIGIPGMEGKTLGILAMDEYMRYPSQELPFKDIIENEVWQRDDVFVQQRLAGLNPMALRKMTREDFSQDFVNKRYDWDKAMKQVTGKESTFGEMIDSGKVFIIDYKLLHDITTSEDYTEKNTTDRREMTESRSPFCVFVSTSQGGVNELKAVAIQTDLTSDAPVFSPVDGAKWMKAKQEIQRADITYAELIEHLLKTHLLMEPICVIMRRTLSGFHPLHQIFKWHCRGLFVTNSLGIKALLLPDEFLHKLFTIGHAGAVVLLNRAYPLMSWADTEFDKNLKRRGVDNVEVLPYFPYRDDGLLIWKEVSDFARKYVNLYYQVDADVTKDSELKNFANELSADGTGDHGGIGMFKGFPVKISTKSQLIDIVKRIVFIPVQHHAVNYPVAYYGAFVPNLPTKLYDDPRVPPQEFGFDSLPQSHVATEQISLAMSLGSLRYDLLFDYGKHLKDNRAKAVVDSSHGRLLGPIEDEITARNNKRLSDGVLTYPYLLPKWMPNSIHT